MLCTCQVYEATKDQCTLPDIMVWVEPPLLFDTPFNTVLEAKGLYYKDKSLMVISTKYIKDWELYAHEFTHRLQHTTGSWDLMTRLEAEKEADETASKVMDSICWKKYSKANNL